MISEVRKKEIEAMVSKINAFSEKYQLIHATVAIEKLYKEQVQQEYQEQFAALRAEIKETNDSESQIALAQRAKELKKESNKRLKISIEYNDKMQADSSRTTKTLNDTFLISLPKCMANIRDDEGNIDFEQLSKLRKLMAHELGHIVLHSGFFNKDCTMSECDSENEADYFAEKLLILREKHSGELAAALN